MGSSGAPLEFFDGGRRFCGTDGFDFFSTVVSNTVMTWFHGVFVGWKNTAWQLSSKGLTRRMDLCKRK